MRPLAAGAAVLALVVATAAPAAPHIETVQGHRVFVVDGLPWFNLSVHPQESAAIEPLDVPLAEYVDTAHELGFTAIRAIVQWDTWEQRERSTEIRANDLTREQLDELVRAARLRGLKINLVWEGTNVTGRATRAPDDLYDPAAPASDPTGTFHRDGDFVPPPAFDYVRDPVRSPHYVLLSDEDGAIAADRPESAKVGVYCPNWPNVLARERAGLEDLARWVRATNEAGDVIVSLQIQNEIRVVVELDPLLPQLPRCRCALSDYLFANRDRVPDGFGADAYPFADFLARYPDLTRRITVDEAFNQWSFQLYTRSLIRAVRSIVPGLPIVMNSFGEDFAESPETDNAGSPIHHVQGWRDVGVDIVGPDMFGFRHEVYQHQFDVGGNLLWAPEFGAQSEPHFQVFGTLGSNVAGDDLPVDTGPAYAGAGYGVFSLYGDVTSLFWGLVSDGVQRTLFPNLARGTWFGPVLEERYRGAFYSRASYHAIRSATTPLARWIGTDRLVAFFDRGYLNDEDNFAGGTWTVGGVPVRIVDEGDPDHPARGAVVKTGDRDFTLVGANYRATIEAAARGGLTYRAERGFWAGDSWVRTAAALPGTVAVDPAGGAVTVALSRDELDTEGAVTPGSGDALDLQYAVRVFTSGAALVDSDGDGVADQDDVCPDLFDDQRDSDGDGVGDACETTGEPEPPVDPGPSEPRGGGGGCRVAAGAGSAAGAVTSAAPFALLVLGVTRRARLTVRRSPARRA